MLEKQFNFEYIVIFSSWEKKRLKYEELKYEKNPETKITISYHYKIKIFRNGIH